MNKVSGINLNVIEVAGAVAVGLLIAFVYVFAGGVR